jgi:hypothetical protein
VGDGSLCFETLLVDTEPCIATSDKFQRRSCSADSDTGTNDRRNRSRSFQETTSVKGIRGFKCVVATAVVKGDHDRNTSCILCPWDAKRIARRDEASVYQGSHNRLPNAKRKRRGCFMVIARHRFLHDCKLQSGSCCLMDWRSGKLNRTTFGTRTLHACGVWPEG